MLMALLAAAATLTGAGVRADDGDPERFRLSGFGTLGVVHSSEHLADFVGSIMQPSGAGASHNWDYAPDSALGLQLDARVTDRISAVVQLVSRHQADGDFAPEVEWANLQLRLAPDLSVRVGRIVLPLFMTSDSRLVGYANPWLRPPPEVYNTGPVTSNDGLDLSWRAEHGGLTTTVQFTIGRARKEFPQGIEVTGRRTGTLGAVLEYQATTLHVHYTSSSVSVSSASLDQLFGGYTQLGQALATTPSLAPAGAAAQALVASYWPSDKVFTALAVGFDHDPGAWFATGEWVREHIGVSLDDSSSGYLTLGARTGAFTPYASWATVVDRPRDRPPLPSAQLPPPYAAAMTGLNQAFVAAVGGFWGPQHSWQFGVRYELTKRADLKLQFDTIHHGTGSDGFLINAQPDLRRGGVVNVIGVGVDFVF